MMRWSKERPAPRAWAVRGAPFRYAIVKGHKERFILLSPKPGGLMSFWTLMDQEENISHFLYADDWSDAKSVAQDRIQEILQ